MNHVKLDPARARQQIDRRRNNADSANCESNRRVHHRHSPHTLIFQSGRMRLLHFNATTRRRLHTPLLICYALVNRPYILDLSRQRSMIARLQDQGIDVYLIDWGTPQRSDRYLSLDDYLDEKLDLCVEQACRHSQRSKVNLMGVCQGGVLSLCYSLAFAHRVRNLITLVTPFDTDPHHFRLNRLSRHIDTGLAQTTYGNLPGPLLNEFFTQLQPLQLTAGKRLSAHAHLSGDNAEHFLLMEQWLQDCPDLAGTALEEFVQLFFRDNALMDPQGFSICGQTHRLAALQPPLLNLYGTEDTLVPPQSTTAARQLLQGKDYTELALKAGHIGMLNGRRALEELPATIAAWLRVRDE
ncbi:alpha/beta fold hydrolase [Marinobacterium weihaiense]|uniref:Alpha/beta fold hydrolase n=1 Tax=Marinobacterium weihaiense TaxID=2851016 RepID=A0ABS6M6M9_9GAMM|nr:alpha/beta fold hydrolase [Marinobacterium weihaiense]MBV0931927.1 alpha/beta fold hydrolase [Marinobacterium weihaiense]